jgi:hypothetical protein
MSKKHLLPKLKTGHNVTTIEKAGNWQPRDVSELDKIAKGLEVKQEVKVKVNSIPDVWARPLLFELALFNKEHPLHEDVKGEWRGLLALLALREYRHITALSTKPVLIALDIEKSPQPRFLKALANLLPDKSLATDTKWNHLYVFLFKDSFDTKHSIGMTSPTTIVCTATDYKLAGFPWYKNGLLIDPQDMLTAKEKISLAGWLSVLKNSLGNHRDIDQERLNSINTLIKDFRKELGGSETTTVTLDTNKSLGMTAQEAGIFKYIDKPSVPEVSTSNVRLIPSRLSTEANPIKPMLIVDKQIAVDWGVSEKNVTVHETVTLANVNYSGIGSDHTILGTKKLTNVEVWTSAQLFTKKLLVVQSENAFPDTLKSAWRDNPPEYLSSPISIVLPVHKKLLEYLTPQDLIKHLSFKQDASSGDITVTLTMTLSGFDNDQDKPYEATHTYSAQDFEIINQVPILEIFPNFVTDSWKVYYVAYSADNKEKTFQISPSVTPSKTSPIKVQGNDYAERYVSQLDEFPEAFYCTYNDNDVGLLLLKQPETPPARNVSYTVGIDFGASGTCVYSSDGTNREPIVFKSRKMLVTKVTDLQRPQIIEFFLPTGDIQIPFLSLYQDFNNRGKDKPSPFHNGHIFFLSLSSQTKLDRDDIIADLKWTNEEYKKICVQAFLKQICLQTSAELVAQGASEIKWKFSYPTTFGDETGNNRLGAFKAIWQQIVRECYAMTLQKKAEVENQDGANNNNENALNLPVPAHISESVASAQYFRDRQNASTSRGTVFIDIGSSTSDISVWQNDNLLWQISLLYAGRNIFLDYLKKHPEVLDTFNLPVNVGGNSENSKFYAGIDSVLHANNKEIFAALPTYADADAIVNLQRHLALGLSGLFYYIGLGVRQLIANKHYEPDLPEIYVGGNGSKMFKWLNSGMDFDQGNSLIELFKSMFLKASGDTTLYGSFKFEMSFSPKKEAAYGLVSDFELKTDDPKKDIIAGEEFRLDNVVQTWDEIISEDSFKHSLQPGRKLEKLNEFIETYNEFAGKNKWLKKVQYDKTLLDAVSGQIGNSLSPGQNQEIIVEPIFILALKHLLAEIS